LGDARIAAAFPADEIALAYQVADQIAVSVENSAELERMRERDRLAALGDGRPIADYVSPPAGIQARCGGPHCEPPPSS